MRLDCLKTWANKTWDPLETKRVYRVGGGDRFAANGSREAEPFETNWFPIENGTPDDVEEEVYRERLMELIKASRQSIFDRLKGVFGASPNNETMNTEELEQRVIKRYGENVGSTLLERERESARQEVTLAGKSYGQEKQRQRAETAEADALTQRQKTESAEEKAMLDGLTGVYNKRFFLDAIQKQHALVTRSNEEISSNPNNAKEKQTTYSLLMFDLDHFKAANDTLGHQKGDLILKTLGELLKKEVRTEDMVCRYGGEEFAIILPGIGAEAAVDLANRLKELIEQKINQELINGQLNQNLSDSQRKAISESGKASIGVATFDGQSNAGQLIESADQALYFVKKSTRNDVRLFDGNENTDLASFKKQVDKKKPPENSGGESKKEEEPKPIETRSLDEIIADGARKIDPEIAALLQESDPKNPEALAKLVDILASQKKAA